MISSQFFYCDTENHNSNPLNLICLNENCSKNCLICCYCLLDSHLSHAKDCCKLELFLEGINKMSLKNPFSKSEDSVSNQYEKVLLKLETEKESHLSNIDQITNKIISFFNEKKQKINDTYNSSIQEIKSSYSQLKDLETQLKQKYSDISKQLEKENSEDLVQYRNNIQDIRSNQINIKGDEINLNSSLIYTSELDINNFLDHCFYFMKNPILDLQIESNLFEKLIESFKIVNNSFIRKKEDLKNILSKLVNSNLTDKKLELIFKGSQDGYKQESFIKKCLGKSNCFSIIKSEYQNIFGAFTSTPFHKNYNFETDNKSFLFSFNNMTKYPIIDPEHALFGVTGQHRGKKLIYCIGITGGICIFEDCNEHNENYIDFSSYQKPNIENPEVFFAGGHKFKVEEFEIYQLI